jgi:hypothetical protein
MGRKATFKLGFSYAWKDHFHLLLNDEQQPGDSTDESDGECKTQSDVHPDDVDRGVLENAIEQLISIAWDIAGHDGNLSEAIRCLEYGYSFVEKAHCCNLCFRCEILNFPFIKSCYKLCIDFGEPTFLVV